MTEEKIDKLLRSGLRDDIILGVVLAEEHLSSEWMKRNFVNKDGAAIYPLRGLDLNGWLLWDDYCVFIGPAYIEYVEYSLSLQKIIIYYDGRTKK